MGSPRAPVKKLRLKAATANPNGIQAPCHQVLAILLDPRNGVTKQQVEPCGVLPDPKPIRTPQQGTGFRFGDVVLAWVGTDLPLIKNRDFSTATAAYPEEPGGDPASSSIVVGTCSISLPELAPERKGYLRGEILMQGWHLKPLQLPGVTATGVHFVSYSKLKGGIPKSVLAMNTKQGGEFAMSLKRLAEAPC